MILMLVMEHHCNKKPLAHVLTDTLIVRVLVLDRCSGVVLRMNTAFGPSNGLLGIFLSDVKRRVTHDSAVSRSSSQPGMQHVRQDSCILYFKGAVHLANLDVH